MDYELQCGPSYTSLDVTLQPGETIVSDSGVMAWKDRHVRAKTSTRGGLLTGLKRKLLSGESFFQNTYVAEGQPGGITFAPGNAGDIVAMPLDGGELLLEKGAYLASDEGVSCDAQYSGILKGLFNEGIFVLRCHGTGMLFFHAYGAIHEIEVDGEYTVDNGYAVAWEPSLDYRVTRARRIRSFLFSDQLLLRYSGRGRLWIQTRSPSSLANFMHPFRPVQSRNSGD